MAELQSNCSVDLLSYKNPPIGIAVVGYNDLRTIPPAKLLRLRNTYSFHYVRNGRGELFIRDKKYALKAGDLFYLPRHEPLAYYPDEKDPWRYFFIDLYDPNAQTIAELLGFSKYTPFISVGNPENITEAFDNLFSGRTSSADFYNRTLAVLSVIIFNTMHRELPEDEPKLPNIVDNAKDIIKLNYANSEFSIKLLADELHITNTHLTRLFHDSMGITPIAYLNKVRLSEASSLIMHGITSIRELCDRCGFKDEHYFMRRFKKHYGYTVKEHFKRTQEYTYNVYKRNIKKDTE